MKTVHISDVPYTNLDFEITEIFPVSWTNGNEFSLYKSKARPCSALFFVFTDISISFFSESGEVTANKGDIVFIPKGSRYHVRVFGKTGLKTDTYTLNLNFFDKSREEILLSEKISVLTNRYDKLLDTHLKNLFDVFCRLERTGTSESRNIAKIKGEFFLILDLIAESTMQHRDFYYPIRHGVEAFCNEWNLNEKIEKYAELCGMSETYFYRCFKIWSGCSPIEYRNNLRLSSAESMLRCTSMKIKEISETVGFEDAFYFCKLFSRKYGTSPRAYRNSMRN